VIYLWAKRMQRRWAGLSDEYKLAVGLSLYFAALMLVWMVVVVKSQIAL
jgi:hypothetical protein